MNSIIDKYIQSSNQPRHKDEIVRIDGWESNTDNSSTSKLEMEAAENTLNKYIKEHPDKFILNVNDQIYRDKFDEYGFEIEE